MPSCVAYQCTGTTRKKRKVTFHRFPKDDHLRDKWIKALGWKDLVITKSTLLCSYHFKDKLIDRSNLAKIRLKEGAVPTRFDKLPPDSEKKKPSYRKSDVNCSDSHLDAVDLATLDEGYSFSDDSLLDSSKIHMSLSSINMNNFFEEEGRPYDPLSGDPDPLGEVDGLEIIPEFEVKEEPYDYYEDNITDTGSPCWISDGVTLGENNGDIELHDSVQFEDNSDPYDHMNKTNSNHHDQNMDVLPDDVQEKLKKGGKFKQKLKKQVHKSYKNFVPYEVDMDDDLDDDLMVVVENASSYKDEMEEFGWKNRSQNDVDLSRKRKELENYLMKCRINVKVMQARLDEERGKMFRIQNALLGVRKQQKRQEIKRMKFADRGNKALQESSGRKRLKMEMDGRISPLMKPEEDQRKRYEAVLEMRRKMTQLREIKARKTLEKRTLGIDTYQKDLENKLRMARLREIKFQKALERKLSTDKQSPEAMVKVKLKPLKIPKVEEMANGESYEKMLEAKLKMARSRELKVKKALEKATNEDSDKTGESEVKVKLKKKKVKRLKDKDGKPYDELRALQMKTKMAKLREIKAKKAEERKVLEDSGMPSPKEKLVKRKYVFKKKLKIKIKQEPVTTMSEGEGKEDADRVASEPEDKESKPEIHIATSHMLWNVLSRIKMEPYQENPSQMEPDESSYFSSQAKSTPSDIPKLVKDFMLRDDVSKVSTSLNSSTSSSSVRYRMHYLPILHKQFEAENGNVCSYASFCSYVPERVVKPHAWQWKYCPCLPCINPELKFEKMVSEEILKMEGVELGDILHDDSKESMLMVQLSALRESRQFFTYDAWERNSSGTLNAKRRTASEPISLVVTKFLEELSLLKSHIQRSFYQYHSAKLARDRSLQCPDEVTLHIECSPLSVYNNNCNEPGSEPAAVFTILTGYLWSQNCEQALAAFSENKDYTTSGIWAGLEKILLSIVKAGKKKINIISDCPTNKYRNKSNFYYMSDFARMYGVCFRWIFLELSHQIGNANMIRDDIEKTIKEQRVANPDMSLAKVEIQKMLQSHTSIIVDSYSHDDVQKYKLNLPKLRVVQGTQKFDEVIILPDDFWVRDVIGFDTFKKLPF